MVHFPLHLLPADVYNGCVVYFQISMRPDDQEERLKVLRSTFDAIEKEASSEVPVQPQLQPQLQSQPPLQP